MYLRGKTRAREKAEESSVGIDVKELGVRC